VVLPVPGLRLAKARLRPVIQAVCQRPRRYGRQLPDAGGRCAQWNCGLRGAGWTSLRTLDPACRVLSRPMSGTVGAWHAGPVCCQTPPSARSPAGPHCRSSRPWLRSPPDGLPVPAWLTRHHGAAGKPTEPGRASVVGTVSRLCRNAVLQYCSIHGRHRGRARRPGPRTARRAFRAQDAGPGTRAATAFAARQSDNNAPGVREGNRQAARCGPRQAGRVGLGRRATAQARAGHLRAQAADQARMSYVTGGRTEYGC
jgi:hypothetical protein